MEGGAQPMDLDVKNEVAIVDAAETRLRNAKYTACGISMDLYQFSYDPTKPWHHGHIFHGSRLEDISFEGHIVAKIDALVDHSKKEAAFLVHESDRQKDVEDMLTRRFRGVKHSGILTPYGAGYNTQISKVVSGYRGPTQSLAEWLQVEAKKPASTSSPISIPIKVQQLIRFVYMINYVSMVYKSGLKVARDLFEFSEAVCKDQRRCT